LREEISKALSSFIRNEAKKKGKVSLLSQSASLGRHGKWAMEKIWHVHRALN
jgi:hypothetical protein